jgi:hypothetical protein
LWATAPVTIAAIASTAAAAVAARAATFACGVLSASLFQGPPFKYCSPRQADLPFAADLSHHDHDLIPHADGILDTLEMFRGELGDMNHPIQTGSQLHKCAEVGYPDNFSGEDLARFGVV